MLYIDLVLAENYDTVKEVFVPETKVRLALEHSLATMSKWESFFKKPFFTTEKSTDETIEYVRMMLVNCPDDFDPLPYLGRDHFNTINKYINDKQTATWFTEVKRPPRLGGEVVTSEIIYYWMISLGIPFECQHWHLERLLTLIKVINLKNQPKKNMSKRTIAQRNRALNAQRKARFGTSG